jgi:hypothetical protein
MANEHCRVCGRTDVGLKKDGTLRMHVRPDRKGISFLHPTANRRRASSATTPSGCLPTSCRTSRT